MKKIMEKIKTVTNEKNVLNPDPDPVRPVYAILQKNRYLKKELTDKIKNFLKKKYTENNFIDHETIDAKNSDAGSVLLKCRTQSFFGLHKIIEVENADTLCSDPRFEEYFSNPQSTTCLILDLEKIPASLKDFELKNKKIYAAEKSAIIRKKLSGSNKTIDAEALNVFSETINEDMGRLDLEIEKILLFTANKANISIEDIKQINVAAANERSIFELVDKISEKNKKGALRILKELILYEDEIRILVMIIRQFRLFLHYNSLIDNKLPKTEIMKQLGMRSDWLFGKFQRQAKNFSKKELEGRITSLVEADLKIKTSGIDRLIILEVLISKLCS